MANEAVFSFTQQGKTIYDVIFRISNNDVAFKYKMYPQGETLSLSLIHICIVDGKNGEWYGLIFQDRGGVGRVPCLMPCTWSEDG